MLIITYLVEFFKGNCKVSNKYRSSSLDREGRGGLQICILPLRDDTHPSLVLDLRTNLAFLCLN